MHGYSSRSYGEAMADVYDEWYHDVSDIDATVACVVHLAGVGGNVLELGVGTGRLALPLAGAGLQVTGIDSSPAMLTAMATKPSGDTVVAVLGDMAGPLPEGPFDVVLVAYNTFFGLLTAEEQQRCMRSVAAVLAPGGCFAVEVFVPVVPDRGSSVDVRTMSTERVVLSVSQFHPKHQRAEGQFVEFTEAGGVRLRPWAVRYAGPAELDLMAAAAGLYLAERWQDFDRSPFTPESARHVSVYRPILMTS